MKKGNRTGDCCVCGNEIVFYWRDDYRKKCPFCGTLQVLNGKYAEELKRNEFYKERRYNTGNNPKFTKTKENI